MVEDVADSRPMPEILQLDLGDLRAVLAAGWADFRAAPLFGLFFAGVYVLGGWLIWWAMTTKGQIWWTIVAGAGFPILGPFIASGFYEVSRRLEQREPLDWGSVLGVILRQKDRQIPTMVGAVFAAVLFALTVVSLPMLLDRDVDFITAMIASWSLVAANPLVMLVWAGLIAASLFVGMLTGFLGHFVVLPLFGHATWHLYRRALD